jgi:flagellar hook-associated protein 3 FlgL
MRVTHRMLTQSVSKNIQNNLRALDEKSRQLSMGRYFDRPSGDPVGTYKVMGIEGTGLSRNEQYRRNIGEGITWLTITEDALAEAIDVVNRLRELSIYAANGTLSTEDRQAIAPEVEQLYHHLILAGNAEVGDLYVFGGHQTQAPPFRLEDGEVEYKGDNGKRKIEITAAGSLAINISGEEAFGEGENGLFQTVKEMLGALGENDLEKLGGGILQKLDASLDRLLQARSEVGAITGRLLSTDDRLYGEHIHLRELRSKIEDIDVAGLITEFMMQENAYQAALATGARMIYPSLIDFLR